MEHQIEHRITSLIIMVSLVTTGSEKKQLHYETPSLLTKNTNSLLSACSPEFRGRAMVKSQYGCADAFAFEFETPRLEKKGADYSRRIHLEHPCNGSSAGRELLAFQKFLGGAKKERETDPGRNNVRRIPNMYSMPIKSTETNFLLLCMR